MKLAEELACIPVSFAEKNFAASAVPHGSRRTDKAPEGHGRVYKG
jgi:hypothetical protein